jgi:hypothetical protein
MSYMEKKALLVQNFGVLKAKRATASLISNKVTDDGVLDKEGRGARDQSILDKALVMEQAKKDSTKADKRANKYKKEILLPDDILDLIPYKKTYEALTNEDEEALSELLSTFAKISMMNAYSRFEHIESKREKKQIMKSHVYLDALLTLHRMPREF